MSAPEAAPTRTSSARSASATRSSMRSSGRTASSGWSVPRSRRRASSPSPIRRRDGDLSERGGRPRRDGRVLARSAAARGVPRPEGSERGQGPHRRDPRGRRRTGGGVVGGRPVRDVPASRRAATMEDRGPGLVARASSAASRRSRSRSRAKDAYARLKYEAGVHRVQRVPVTESQGRIHTSTATVAVMPEAEEVEVELRPEDLQIDVYRSSGTGRTVGQHDRLGGADRAQADRHQGRDAGGALAAAEPREGDALPARAPVPARARRGAGEGGRGAPRAARHRGALREDPHLQLPGGSRHRPPDQAHLASAAGRPRRRARSSMGSSIGCTTAARAAQLADGRGRCGPPRWCAAAPTTWPRTTSTRRGRRGGAHCSSVLGVDRTAIRVRQEGLSAAEASATAVPSVGGASGARCSTSRGSRGSAGSR